MQLQELTWLAGLLEGEGCFYNSGRKGKPVRPAIRLAMTDEDVVARAATLMGPRGYNRQHSPSWKAAGTRPQYVAYVTGEPAAVIMRAIRPHLGLRRGSKIDALLAQPDIGTEK